MQRLKSPSILALSACLAAACLPASGQTVKQYGPTPPPKEKLVVDKTHPAPFAAAGDSGRSQAVVFRTADQMTAHDRQIAANAESSIAENTRYADLEFNQGTWTYQQVVCPALPQHVFLRFLRNSGAGDTTLFTASIPPDGEGRVRIIPIRLRGYSLFSPAPINAITIAAFNKIRAEENPDHAPVSDWLSVGLCYAALAGGRPELPPLQDDAVKHQLIAQNKGILDVSGSGATITFNDVSAPARTMTWTMTFDRNGKLLKASHSGSDSMRVREVKPNPVDTNPKVVDMSQPMQQTEAVAPGPDAVTLHPVPPPQAQ